LVSCASYQPEAVADAVRAVLAPLGGIESAVRPGQTVLLKPNLLTDRAPHEAVTTHPEVVRAVIRLVKARGAVVRVGDSPASVVRLESVWNRTGMAVLCREENVELVNMEKEGSRTFETDGYSFSLSRAALDADVLIDLPKVKTHVLTVLTAAVKNLYGAVPGPQKTLLHKQHPTAGQFGRLIAAIYRACPPALSIADGVVGMEGDGPSAGRPVHLGFLAASPSALALDLVLCRMLKINPNRVPYIAPLLTDPGAPDPSRIETVGVSPDVLAPRRFPHPSGLPGRLIPRRLVSILSPLLWIRPSISDACVACGLCARACPTQALTHAPGRPPAFDASRCIGCCCCHEVCPERAVTMKQSALIKLMRGGSPP
jgi:uncharacterized protein (DUF362 family)/NAD-dependent dihydropyrimidine dehydrogenase PreA subunit